MKRMILLVSIQMLLLNIQAQNFTTVPDSVDFVEHSNESIQLFDGALEFGRIVGKIYFKGEGLTTANFIDKNGLETLGYREDFNRYEFEYLKHPHAFFSYNDKDYNLSVRLITVDWPGNEINWRKIPRIYFKEIEK